MFQVFDVQAKVRGFLQVILQTGAADHRNFPHVFRVSRGKQQSFLRTEKVHGQADQLCHSVSDNDMLHRNPGIQAQCGAQGLVVAVGIRADSIYMADQAFPKQRGDPEGIYIASERNDVFFFNPIYFFYFF